MKPINQWPEFARVTNSEVQIYSTKRGDDFGKFQFTSPEHPRRGLMCIVAGTSLAQEHYGWEHVSVSAWIETPDYQQALAWSKANATKLKGEMIIPMLTKGRSDDRPSFIRALPTWTEMKFIKEQFWLPEETVLQFHPKASQYVNTTEEVLHLWKKIGVDHELPPKVMV